MSEPIQRLDFDASHLLAEHPPVWRHPSKQLVFDVACPAGTIHQGTLGYTRWGACLLPSRIAWPMARELVSAQPNFFDYLPCVPAEGATEWHVNFADPNLFVAYGTPLMAQDEMQVAEHPSLGALLEALEDRGIRPYTSERGAPTPILVTGAQRWCQIATEPNAAQGRPQGLYGNRFAAADEATIRKAVTRVEPPTISNFIAIAAPLGGAGLYTEVPIRYSLSAAYTGFRAAVELSLEQKANIHTGFWGCGAFGGNRVLMTIVQLLAASAAGVNRLVFHTGDTTGLKVIEEAWDHLAEIFVTPNIVPSELIAHLVDRKFRWGVSDGN